MNIKNIAITFFLSTFRTWRDIDIQEVIIQGNITHKTSVTILFCI